MTEHRITKGDRSAAEVLKIANDSDSLEDFADRRGVKIESARRIIARAADRFEIPEVPVPPVKLKPEFVELVNKIAYESAKPLIDGITPLAEEFARDLPDESEVMERLSDLEKRNAELEAKVDKLTEAVKLLAAKTKTETSETLPGLSDYVITGSVPDAKPQPVDDNDLSSLLGEDPELTDETQEKWEKFD